jgi:hypothetical protein
VAGVEVHHSAQSSAKVKKEWCYTSPPPCMPHSMDRASVTFSNFAEKNMYRGENHLENLSKDGIVLLQQMLLLLG